MDLMVWKYIFGKERYIKQINDTRKWQKKNDGNLSFKRKRLCLKRIRGYDPEESGKVEVGTLLIGNRKNSVIADKVLSYF